MEAAMFAPLPVQAQQAIRCMARALAGKGDATAVAAAAAADGGTDAGAGVVVAVVGAVRDANAQAMHSAQGVKLAVYCDALTGL